MSNDDKIDAGVDDEFDIEDKEDISRRKTRKIVPGLHSLTADHQIIFV